MDPPLGIGPARINEWVGKALMAHPSRGDKEGQKGSRTSSRPQAGMR